MSTRSTTHFLGYDGRLVANVYRHSDGYPEGHGADLKRFFDEVEAQTQDTRYSDPSYLAAKLVVWLASEFATTYSHEGDEFTATSHFKERPLDFLSVGVVIDDPSDIEFFYEVDCEHTTKDGRPEVRCFQLHGSDTPQQVAIPAEVEA